MAQLAKLVEDAHPEGGDAVGVEHERGQFADVAERVEVEVVDVVVGQVQVLEVPQASQRELRQAADVVEVQVEPGEFGEVWGGTRGERVRLDLPDVVVVESEHAQVVQAVEVLLVQTHDVIVAEVELLQVDEVREDVRREAFDRVVGERQGCQVLQAFEQLNGEFC